MDPDLVKLAADGLIRPGVLGGAMDPPDLARVQADLVAWGLLEAGEPHLTRRFRGAVARAAGILQEREAAGEAPPGHPLENAIALALEESELPVGAVLEREHRRFLFAVELASLPEAVRALLDRR